MKLVGYAEIIKGETTLPDPTSSNPSKEDIVVLEMNDQAYNDLIHACEDEMVFCCIDDATTEKHKAGDSSISWKHLSE